jgi:hypothetical protein
MSVVNLPIIPPTLDANYCFTSYQQLANDIVGGAIVQFDATGSFGVLVQTTTPTPAQRNNFLWFNLTTEHLLRYDTGLGEWVQKHYVPASDERRWWFEGVAGNVPLVDGGEVGAVGLAAGPFWEIDHNYDARMPLGAGTLPSTTVVAVSGTGGVETVTLAKVNLPTDEIDVKTAIVGRIATGSDVPVVGNTYGSDSLAGSGRSVDSTTSDFSDRYYTRGRTLPLGSGTAFSVLPPYRAGYWLKRTARVYWKS